MPICIRAMPKPITTVANRKKEMPSGKLRRALPAAMMAMPAATVAMTPKRPISQALTSAPPPISSEGRLTATASSLVPKPSCRSSSRLKGGTTMTVSRK